MNNQSVPLSDNVPGAEWEAWASKYFRMGTLELQNTSIAPDTDLGLAQENINYLWGETLTNLVFAASDEEFDVIYDNFLKERENLGYSAIMAERQKLVDANRAKLGS